MAMNSRSLDNWREYFRTANSDIFDIIEHAIMVAASDCPKEFRLRRDRIAEQLFSSRMTRCLGCDRVELAVPDHEDEDEDGGCKSGFDTDRFEFEAGGSKESKANSSRDNQEEEMNMNQLSTYSYGEAEALTDEIEEENQIIEEVLRIKDILENSQDQCESVLFESLRRLQLMALSVDILKATEIGKTVKLLRKHDSKRIRNLTRTLIDGWMDMVDEWVNATKAIAEGTPESLNPSVVDEEEGLPSPPLDEGAFFATETSIELSQFFDGMDDFGNPQNSGEFNKNRENGRRPLKESQDVVKRKPQALNDSNGLARDRSLQIRKQEANVKLNKPSHTGISSGKPPKVNVEKKMSTETRVQRKPDKVAIQRRPVHGLKDKLKSSDETAVQVKLEATKRRLQESYQQAENAKRQRTIQVMELRDLPKQGLGHRNPHFRPGNRHWANGRR